MYLILQKMKEMGLDTDIASIYRRKTATYKQTVKKWENDLTLDAQSTAAYHIGLGDVKKDVDALREQLKNQKM